MQKCRSCAFVVNLVCLYTVVPSYSSCYNIDVNIVSLGHHTPETMSCKEPSQMELATVCMLSTFLQYKGEDEKLSKAEFGKMLKNEYPAFKEVRKLLYPVTLD